MKISNFHNPYFPKRKIRHAKLLTSFGFKIDVKRYLNRDIKHKLTDCNKLIYWVNEDIRITLFDYMPVSRAKFLEFYRNQVEYHMRNKAKIVFD